jgi:hydrogenase maturation protein HypF
MIQKDTGLERVVLSGGVFQNALLLTRTKNELHRREFEVFVPTKLPPNDGGISFGQALIANAQAALNGAQ